MLEESDCESDKENETPAKQLNLKPSKVFLTTDRLRKCITINNFIEQ